MSRRAAACAFREGGFLTSLAFAIGPAGIGSALLPGQALLARLRRGRAPALLCRDSSVGSCDWGPAGTAAGAPEELACLHTQGKRQGGIGCMSNALARDGP